MTKGAKAAVVLASLASFAIGFTAGGVRRGQVSPEQVKVAAESPVAQTATNQPPASAESPKAPEQADVQPSGQTSLKSNSLDAKEPDNLKILKVDYNGDDRLTLTLSARPDMDVVRNYISVEPMNEGVPSFRYNAPGGVPKLYVSGDFSFRTNSTLKIRAGLGALDGATAALNEEFSYEFSRKDRSPEVSFADAGRYLPPGGERAMMVRSVNVTNLEVAVRSVPTANVVHFLAIEEEAYNNIRRDWWSEGEDFARDLAGSPMRFKQTLAEDPNKMVDTAFSIGNSNGVFLASAGIADQEASEYRLVCISDIGLSVREAKGALLAWATSLTDGRPLCGVNVVAYSSGNVPVADGVTGEDGLAALKKVADGEPFAVVASIADAAGVVTDATFIALRSSMKLDEKDASMEGDDAEFLKRDGAEAFVWTDRGIYRHDEKVMVHAILRGSDGAAPKPFPVVLNLRKPSGRLYATEKVMPDTKGAVFYDGFSVAADEPSGEWTIEIATPGKKGVTIGSRSVKIEEFAPPTIRVKVEASSGSEPTNFSFVVKAEHLFGGPAKGLRCEGAVVFEDAEFAPEGWSGWRFGNEQRGLAPCYRRVGKGRLDDSGENEFAAPLWASAGRPKAAIRVTAEGTAFEDGGRPATARDSATLHYYPYYIGTTLKGWMRRPQEGPLVVPVACVLPSGERLQEPRRLTAKLERIDTVYSYSRNARGWASWNADKTRVTIADDMPVDVAPGADGQLTLPVYESGDWFLTISDPDGSASFGAGFYLSEERDDGVRARLSDPTDVTLTPDKAHYRVGDVPRLQVRAPFAGTALLTIMREGVIYAEVVNLPDATCEVLLPPVERGMAPSLDVSLCVVHGEEASSRRLAVRAHGEVVLSIRPEECELPVEITAAVDFNADSGATVAVDLAAPGADFAVVTLVDEAINILTGEATPDPIGYFGRKRTAQHPLYDLYHRLLPVVGSESLKRSGVKTGGGFGAEMLSRISPQPTRRFKPLALWQFPVAVKDGRAEAFFELPEFVGEVRITAVAYSAIATGAASIRRKVTPKVVMGADAPRFAAPGDTFEVTLSLANRSGTAAEVDYELSATGATALQPVSATVHLAEDASKVLTFWATATEVGEGEIVFRSSGCGERHERRLLLPVRPAAPWRVSAGVDVLPPGESRTYGASQRASFDVCPSAQAELSAAYKWLAQYPHGCLEQTTSRIFPLLASGDKAHADFIEAGVRRVESMMREYDFVMWPDCSYSPWDPDVSLYAAHFLVASKLSVRLDQLYKYLGRWAMSTNSEVSAYACHTLALAGRPEKDRMLRLYDKRDSLSPLSRARLARAFIAGSDRARAVDLLANAAAPNSVKEAAFAMLALMDLDPQDSRIPALAIYLRNERDRQTFSWGTTEENAHALLALGEYHRRLAVSRAGTDEKPNVVERRGDDGSTTFTNNGGSEAFIAWQRLSLPDVASLKDEDSVITVSRKFMTVDGCLADLAAVDRGDLLNVVITIGSNESRDYSDLVIEDLFPAGFEPVFNTAEDAATPDWVMRTDVRDDRFLAFSKRFHLDAGEEAVLRYQVRAVTAGAFLLPGTSVEAMYYPHIHSSRAPGRVNVGN